MKFSIIIPSYNQPRYIRQTLLNVAAIKEKAATLGMAVEILLFDNESDGEVLRIVDEFSHVLDYVEIKKDKGQYDAINKGIQKCRGDYWTWLNTDDCIEQEGFFKLAGIVQQDPSIDYIYGSTKYIDESGEHLFTNEAKLFRPGVLARKTPGIFQPGSFFRTSFTARIGLLEPYRCCFDYEYVLRCIKNNAKLYCCAFPVASFRYYTDSKTGTMIPVFIREQLEISKKYGRRGYDFLTWFSYLRLFKHRLFRNK